MADGGTDTFTSSPAAGVAATVTYTITNTGTDTLTLTTPSVGGTVSGQSNVTVDSLTLGSTTVAPGGGTTTLTVSYTPAAAGAFGFDLDIVSDDADETPYDITASGTASGAPEIGVSSSEGGAVADGGTDTFTSSPVAGVAATVTYTIANTGTDTLTLTTPSVGGTVSGQSNVTVDSLTLGSTTVGPGGGTTTLTVSYIPTAAGAFGFDLDIVSDDADETPYDITASGTASGGTLISGPDGTIEDGGTDAVASSPAAGGGAQIVYTITNTGAAPLTLAAPNVADNVSNSRNVVVNSLTLVAPAVGGNVPGGNNATVKSLAPRLGRVVPSGETVRLVVDYTPVLAGAFAFDLSVKDSGGSPVIDFTVSGTATGAPEIDVSSSEGGAVPDGGTDEITSAPAPATAASVTYTITNTGSETLTLSAPSIGTSIAAASNVSVNSLTLGSTLVAPSGGTTTLIVNYTPTADGPFGFDLDIVSDDADETPYDIRVSGGTAGRPTVMLSDAPDGFAGRSLFRVTASFSEAVTGFEAGDVAVTAGTVSAVSGSGAIYILSIQPAGNGSVRISIPAGVAKADSGLTNLASGVVNVENETAEITRTEIAKFMGQRAGMLMSSQPDLHRFVFGKNRGAFSLSTTGDATALNLRSRSDQPVWFTLQGSWANVHGAENDYVFGAFGGHTWLDGNTALGAMVEFDSITREDGDARIKGQGWLAGPYLAFGLPEQPLYLHGYMLYGRSDNEIAPFGTYTDEFETERVLVHAELTGELERERVTWFPNVSASYASDEQEGYIDSLGNYIKKQKIELGAIALGVGFDRTLGSGITPWSLDGEVQASYTYNYGANGSSSTLQAVEGARARVELGVTYATDAVNFRLSGFHEGLGLSNFEQFGLSLSYERVF
ncbi:hypothetical protein PAA8504_03696 [Palleronia abyssalis]|uniref:Autotransporter domain-containing protein n=1 Tax=Palleronia abyssalis TaxID=1501240 RepID=A0A2R8C0C2_9RHOB|nr:hypothetical protein PAA8504_03696 [Palleronia abyssalis]